MPWNFHLKQPQYLLIVLNVLFRTSVWGAWGINTKNLTLLSHLQINFKELIPLFCLVFSFPDRKFVRHSELVCFQLHTGSISADSIAGYKWKSTGNNLPCGLWEFSLWLTFLQRIYEQDMILHYIFNNFQKGWECSSSIQKKNNKQIFNLCAELCQLRGQKSCGPVSSSWLDVHTDISPSYINFFLAPCAFPMNAQAPIVKFTLMNILNKAL